MNTDVNEQSIDISELSMFKAGSANDEKNIHLWIKGASLFIPQLNTLLKYTNYKFNIIDIEVFDKMNKEECNDDCYVLANLFEQTGSDKSTTHNYHIIYSYILNKLGIESKLNILEIGMGTNNPNIVSNMGFTAKPGASLYAFEMFLNNSNIYGADIDKDILFQTNRIKTCYVDQLNMDTFNTLVNNFGNIKYDLIIDDGLHSIGANFNTLLFALENINMNGWVVIEDIENKYITNFMSIDYILSNNNQFKTYIVKTKNSFMYLVNKL
jgi:hypothetical protein